MLGFIMSDFLLYCNSLCPEFENLCTLVSINKTSKHQKGDSASSQTCQDDTNLTEVLNEEEKSNDSIDSTGNCSEPGTKANYHQAINTAFYKGLGLEGKFVSKNVFNLPRRNLSPPEISLLSKGLKFVSSANKIDRAILKRQSEEYGRKLRLMWHFRNDEQTFTAEKFRPKSSFKPRNEDAVIETYLSCLEERLLDIEIPSKRYNNLTRDEPRNKDAIIETYLSCLEERLLDIEIPSKRYNNLTRDKRDVLYSLKDDPSIIIKGTDKGSVVVVWDREDYLKEAYQQLYDSEVYEEIPNEPNESTL